MFRLLIDIPSIDRLVDYLEGKQQVEIDQLSGQITALTQRLQTHRTALEGQIEKEK